MKRFVLYTNTISPHQLPLAKELARHIGEDNFRYIHTEVADNDHGALGWTLDVPGWCIDARSGEADEWLEGADILLSGLRCFDLFERRAERGLKSFYTTERWFKPPIGIAKLLHPRYFGYARRLCKLMESGAVVGLPIGIHAARDMARMCGLMNGDLRCLFRAPQLEFERKPGGRIFCRVDVEKGRNGDEGFGRVEREETCRRGDVGSIRVEKKYCLDKMRMWGYFVAPSDIHALQVKEAAKPKKNEIKVLWVGRLLDLKRVDVAVRAVGEHANLKRVDDSLPKITLDIYGTGPEEARLKKLASKYGDVIKFYPPVPINEVRRLMREHDVYVLCSNGYEGWGAVVSEALEEGMKVVGTYEAGSSATMLPEECLSHAGDWRGLLRILQNNHIPRIGIDGWSANNAASALMNGIA